MKVSSVSFKDFAEDMPEQAGTVLERYGVSRRIANKLHVLIFEADPQGHAQHTTKSRHVTAAVLVTEPVELDVRAIGVAIKCPEDALVIDRGENIAVSRALIDLRS